MARVGGGLSGAVSGGGGTRHTHLCGDVRERKVGKDDGLWAHAIARVGEEELDGGGGVPREVVVREHDALGHARRARRVDELRALGWIKLRLDGLDLGDACASRRLALAHELAEGAHASLSAGLNIDVGVSMPSLGLSVYAVVVDLAVCQLPNCVN